jgi:alpha-tubulin suppressor-like RCC1 family protein
VVPPNTHVPSVVDPLPEVVALAAGFGHSLAVDTSGNVWSWGDNGAGQLGNHSHTGSLLPTKLASPQHAKAVATGGNHSLALLEDGSVWAWGDNQDGELGVGSVADSDAPLKIEGLTDVVAIAAGGRHSIALRRDGTVKVWGTNGYGQLCNGTTTAATSPINLMPPADTKAAPRYTAIAAGQFHTLAVDDTGHVWSCGWNVFGQLGNGRASKPREGEPRLSAVVGLDEVVAVAAGHLHSLALRRNGTVFGWGYNTQGQVGNESSETHEPDLVKHVSGGIALTAGATTSFVVLADHTVVAWGANVFGALGNNSLHNFNGPTKVPGLRNVRLLVAGGNRGMAIADPPAVAQLAATGADDHGQMGPFRAGQDEDIPDQLRRPLGVGAGYQHSLAIARDGTVWAWGRNDHGQLGNGKTGDSAVPVRVVGLENVAAVTGGEHHSLALRSDGTVWGWGSNAHGQLGGSSTTDSLVPIQVTGLDQIVAIASGASHNLALRFDRRVWSWGLDDHGQLGLMGGGETRVPSEVHDLTGVTAIAAGAFHSLALKSSGRMCAWGDNGKGQLGHVGGAGTSRVPIDVDDIEDGTFITAGPFQSFAVQSGGSVWAWGSNSDHQLGIGRDDTVTAKPVRVLDLREVLSLASAERMSWATNASGAVFAWGKSGPLPVRVPDSGSRVQIAAGNAHALVR